MSLITNIISVFKYEVVEIAKNHVYLTTLVVLPFVTLLFLGIMFYGGSIENLPIVIVDNDHSTTSRQLLQMVSATRGVEINEQVNSTYEANKIIQSGKAYALLFIPEGLEHNIYLGTPANIECYISGTNLSASGIIESEIESCARTFAAGIELSKLQSQGANQYRAMQEVMPINILTHTISNPYLNYGYYLAPIFIFLALGLFTTLLTTYAIGRELYYATAPKWLDTATGNTIAAIIGKLAPTTIIMTIFSQLSFFIIFRIMGLECAGSYTLLSIGAIVFILAYQSVAMFITTITANMRLALSLGGGYAVMAFTFSGITFPKIAMFRAIQPFTDLFPLTWFTEIFVDQALRGAPIEYSVAPLGTLLLFLFLPLFIIKRLKRISSKPQYWSKD